MNNNVYYELERIRRINRGFLKPADVVSEAQHPESVLHPYFEWNDTKAAHEHRLEQARKLIRVSVTILPGAEDYGPIRAYVKLNDDNPNQGYRASTEVLSDTHNRKRLLDQALKEMATFRNKYRVLTELAEIFKAMDDIAS